MVTRRSVAALLCALIVSPVFTAGAGPTAVPADVSWSPYDLTSKSGRHWPAQLGTLRVPAVRANKQSGSLTLRFVRLAATGTPDGPPIIYLAGGPGSSAIEAAQGDRFVLFERIRRHGDVILLEQRGAGLSDPPPPCSHPWAFPASAADEPAMNRSLQTAVRRCAEDWRAGGIVIEAYTTAESVADIADLIVALGVPKVRFVAISYGTFLGFQFLRDRERMVDRAVFAGSEGPDHTVKLPTQADQVLSGLSQRLRGDTGSPAPEHDLESTVRRVFAGLERSPERVTRKDGSAQVVSLYDAQLVTAFLMATSENARGLPKLFAAMDSGDFEPMVTMMDRLGRFYGALPLMPLAMDAATPSSAERMRRASRLARESVFGNAVNFPSADVAGALGIRTLPSRYQQPVRSRVPALFISGSLDPRTPPANAEEVRRGFISSSHLIIDGAGHDNDLFLSTPVILDRIESFLGGAMLRDERVIADWSGAAAR